MSKMLWLLAGWRFSVVYRKMKFVLHFRITVALFAVLTFGLQGRKQFISTITRIIRVNSRQRFGQSGIFTKAKGLQEFFSRIFSREQEILHPTLHLRLICLTMRWSWRSILPVNCQ